MSDPNSERVECTLCGATDNKMTKEHVFGDWLSDVLPEPERRRDRRLFAQNPETGESEWREWTEKEFRHQTKRRVFCDPCNNIFGLRIEIPAQAVLPDLIHGVHHSVTDAGAMAVAAWAAKVAVLRETFDPPEQRMITVEQRRKFRETFLPPDNFLIFAVTISAHAKYWPGRDRHWTVPYPVGDDIPATANMQITTVGLKRLGLIVVSNTFGGPILDPPFFFAGLMVRLWPEPRSFTWPLPEHLSDTDRDDFSDGREGMFFPTQIYGLRDITGDPTS